MFLPYHQPNGCYSCKNKCHRQYDLGTGNVYESSQNGNEHRNSKHHFIFDCAGCAVYFIHRKGAAMAVATKMTAGM